MGERALFDGISRAWDSDLLVLSAFAENALGRSARFPLVEEEEEALAAQRAMLFHRDS